MRATPLAIYGSKLSLKELYLLTDADVKMTHPNYLVHEAVFMYCVAIKLLLDNRHLPEKSSLVVSEIIRMTESK
jgi:hypothetical protein